MSETGPAPMADLANQEAWADIVGRLRAYLRQRVQPQFVDDLLGAIVLRLIEHQEQLREADNQVAWIYRVAANTVTDHYRHYAVEQRSLSRLLQFTQAANATRIAGPTLPLETDASPLTELSACIPPLLETLPESYAQAMKLTDLEGLTQRDACSQLSLSHSGVKSRVQRGRARLKKAIERCCAVERDGAGQVSEIVPHDGDRKCTNVGQRRKRSEKS